MPDDAIEIQGFPVSTDDRGGVQMQRFLDGDAVVATPYVLAVTSGGTFLPAGNVNTRRQLAIVNWGDIPVEMAPTSVSWGQGFPLDAGSSMSTNYSGTIFFRTQAGTADIRAWGEA